MVFPCIHPQLCQELDPWLRFRPCLPKLRNASRGWIIIGKRKTWLKNRAHAALPSPQQYTPPQEKVLALVTFDIPEQQARKRVWLRKTLIHLGFSMLQKSVWLSTHPLPKDLISDLQKLGILDNVEILAITKMGSIRTMR